MERTRILKGITRKVGKEFFGASPPSVFVGRVGYPDVFVGALAPATGGDTSDYDAPRRWYEEQRGLDEVFMLRSSLINSRTMVNVKRGGRLLDNMQELALSARHLDIEARYKKELRPSVSVYNRAAPTGPAANIEKLEVCENPRVPVRIDKVVSDTDLRATWGIGHLYEHGVDENHITKLLSVGLMGVRRSRKLVPTRWSITAVDDTISKHLVKGVKQHKELDSYLLFSNEYLGNRFEIVLLPSAWALDVLEAKLPGSVWNPQGQKAVIFQDHEFYDGRKSYADNVTGAYYCVRLAAAEHLLRMKRQAAVVSIREVSEDYDAPLGVWVIRETVRGAFRKKPERHDTLESALASAGSRLKLPISLYKQKSPVLDAFRKQTRLSSFLKQS